MRSRALAVSVADGVAEESDKVSSTRVYTPFIAGPLPHSGANAMSESNHDAASRRVLFSNIGWMLAGNVSYGLSQWALLVALAKIGTLEMVGSFAMAMAISLPVLMFSSLSLRSLQVTDYKKSFRFVEYAALRIVTVALATVVIMGFGLVSGYRASALASITLIGAAKAIEYLSDILYGLLQQQEDMAGIAISMILRAALSVAALSFGVYATHSLLWGAIALLAVSAGVFVGYDIPKMLAVSRISLPRTTSILRSYTEELRTGGYRRLWKLGLAGLPMGFVLMMVSLNLSIARYFIQHSLGMAELGIFSAIATLPEGFSPRRHGEEHGEIRRFRRWTQMRERSPRRTRRGRSRTRSERAHASAPPRNPSPRLVPPAGWIAIKKPSLPSCPVRL